MTFQPHCSLQAQEHVYVHACHTVQHLRVYASVHCACGTKEPCDMGLRSMAFKCHGLVLECEPAQVCEAIPMWA